MDMTAIAIILAGVFGATLGSFINVVIYRLPRGESLLAPGSHCPSCRAAVKPYDNVPVLAWLWLRGHCRALPCCDLCPLSGCRGRDRAALRRSASGPLERRGDRTRTAHGACARAHRGDRSRAPCDPEPDHRAGGCARVGAW